jgi:hypothetical protein
MPLSRRPSSVLEGLIDEPLRATDICGAPAFARTTPKWFACNGAKSRVSSGLVAKLPALMMDQVEVDGPFAPFATGIRPYLVTISSRSRRVTPARPRRRFGQTKVPLDLG